MSIQCVLKRVYNDKKYIYVNPGHKYLGCAIEQKVQVYIENINFS